MKAHLLQNVLSLDAKVASTSSNECDFSSEIDPGGVGDAAVRSSGRVER